MNPAPYLQYSLGTQQQFNRWKQSYQQDQQSYQQFDQQAFQQQSPFQDYRDHNQDDIDSSEHNKSVQVESEEEEEEEPVNEHFHHLVKDKSMTVDQIYSKWNDMNSSMKKWNGFYQQASMNHKSGEGDEQLLKKAMKNYKTMVKSKGFARIQAWEMVRDNPFMVRHSTSRLPTRKGKRSAASSSSHDELIQQMMEFNPFNKEESQKRFRLREEKLRVLQEEKDARVQLMRQQ
ncbi:hypothetical protein R6Q57_013171 [Mikania cordata]